MVAFRRAYRFQRRTSAGENTLHRQRMNASIIRHETAQKDKLYGPEELEAEPDISRMVPYH